MKLPFSLPLATAVFSIFTASCQPQATAAANPEEVGKVVWGRDYDAALALSKSTGKPIFLLFQEVPGCAGCKQFGRDVLSDDVVVKLIQNNFVPLLIHNNKPGKDAEVLAMFNENAWDYQVVRFLDTNGHDLIPRKDRVWEAPELKQRIDQVLKKKAGRIQRVAIAQPCFWSGEMKIGAIDGVRRTEAGYLDGREVTLVDYDAGQISLENLTVKAKAAKVATGVYTKLDGYQKAPEFDQKRQLQGTKYADMKLTPEQATKVNAFAKTFPERVKEFLPE